MDVRQNQQTPQRVLLLDTGLTLSQWPTQAALRAAAEAAARAALLARAGVTNIDVTVLQNHLCYLRDYDLGDRCDVRDDRLQVQFEGRIIEINEVWKEGAHTVSLQFGDKLPTAYGR